MSRFIVPVGSDVVATWSHSNTHRNTQFKFTTKEAIFEDIDINLELSNNESSRLGFDVVVFNLPTENVRDMYRIAIRASDIMRK